MKNIKLSTLPLPRGYTKDIWSVFFARIVTAVGFSVSMPYLSLYLHNERGIAMGAVGAIIMAATIVGSFLAIIGGELSDQMGRKRVMVSALFWRFLIFAMMGYAIVQKSDIFIISGLLILNSAFGSFFMPASQSYIADLTTIKKRTSAYGLLRIGGNLGWALGPAIGGLLAAVGYAFLFFFTALCMLVAGTILLRFSKESIGEASRQVIKRTNLKEVLSVINDRRFLSFTIICWLIFVVWGQLIYPLSIYSVNRIGITKPQLGLLFSINGIMVVLFQYLITRAITVPRQLTAVWTGALIYALGYALIGIANTYPFLIICVIIITVAEMIVSPTTLSYASMIADENHRGRYMGFFNLSQSMGWATAPVIGGLLLDTFQGKTFIIWGIIGSLALVSSLGFILFKNRYYNFSKLNQT